MSQFNLIDEKWIPVRYLDGSRGELGIHDALLQSKEIAAIEDASPLIVAALHRFLLALLYRALEGPTDIDQAKALFKDGLPGNKIAAYLERWRDRFWLFDEKYPFGQSPNVPKGEIEPWTKLTPEYNATSNKVLFDHTNTKSPGVRDAKECARWLLSTMSFSISGGRGYYPSPSSNAIMCIPLGRNLQETLSFNLVPYPNRNIMRGDSALWERDPKALPLDAPKRVASGYADLYTWQPRMVRLEQLPSGGVAVIRFVAGHGFDNPSDTPDPMQSYKTDKSKGKLPIQFKEDRRTWRDFDSLLPDAGELAPLTVLNALRLTAKNVLAMPRSALVLGLRYEPPSANVDFWRMERFALPEALAGERDIRICVSQFLTHATEVQQALWIACSEFARCLLSKGDRSPEKKDIKGFVTQMHAIPRYWSILEIHFHEIVHEFTLNRNPEDLRYQWLKFVRNTFKTAWEEHRASISGRDAWAIRALAKAEKPILRKLQELNDEISKFELQKENT